MELIYHLCNILSTLFLKQIIFLSFLLKNFILAKKFTNLLLQQNKSVQYNALYGVKASINFSDLFRIQLGIVISKKPSLLCENTFCEAVDFFFLHAVFF